MGRGEGLHVKKLEDEGRGKREGRGGCGRMGVNGIGNNEIADPLPMFALISFPEEMEEIRWDRGAECMRSKRRTRVEQLEEEEEDMKESGEGRGGGL